ncbi:cysteine desulfurase family protein [Sphingomonas prati]|uniref:Cysteine desulfurase n=1 Tax=Sphingomonas prati TaxID=1843237 RepID=A0A7W9BQL1_9SPHN|nr:cysteine desulfurase family protein [Sphingomonas prati]MBB5728185.1 cysteine desulfurase [Sphingomonas prati]GGE75733.1 cysteine desulfurase IscS [Sphingomonas prati]
MIYLDYQATTPLAPEARAAMLPWLAEDGFANPHSPHKAGRGAAAAVAAARTRIVAADPALANGKLWFTSGATEAVNWAIQATLVDAPATRRGIVTIATEHACTLDTAAWAARHGADVTILPVGPDGLIDLTQAAAAIGDRTAIVSAMLVNNEIGVIQPLAELAAIARAAGALFLCDAAQAYGRVPLPDADLIALSAHKIHGPKGIGALYVRDGIRLGALLHGGGQEGGIRSGTLSPMLCAGFGAAATVTYDRRDTDAAHVMELAQRFRAALPDWTVNGSTDHRYPGNLSLRRDGVDAAGLISRLRNVAFSAGSACASGSGRPSHVLRAIGLSDAHARNTIRLGFGRYTTSDEIDTAAALIAAAA